MSFARPDIVYTLVESLMLMIGHEMGVEFIAPFRRMPYADAIATYGSDKPDLRCGLEIRDLSDVFKDAEFRVFKQIVAEGGTVRGISVPGGNKYTRNQIDTLARKSGVEGKR